MSDLSSELTAIREKHGRLTPRLVLEEARDPEHPLHSRFEWDDEQAAESWRLAQARELIRSVRLSFVNAKGETRTPRHYYAVRAPDADEFTYDPLEEIMADAFRRKLLLNDMKRRIDELVNQYGAIEEFWSELRKTLRRKKAS